MVSLGIISKEHQTKLFLTHEILYKKICCIFLVSRNRKEIRQKHIGVSLQYYEEYCEINTIFFFERKRKITRMKTAF